MLTLLIDGQWLLKKNYYKRKSEEANGEKCGGSYGFIDSLRSVINKTLPDRVVVMWDGFNSGKLRYEIYKPYKANRKKSWDREKSAIITEGMESAEEKEIVELLEQKLTIKNFLEELLIRHLEVDLIEADDLIAYYILSSKIPNEEIIIYSRDKDYLQLISPSVYVLRPDNLKLITIQNKVKEVTMGKLKSPKGNIANAYRINPPTKTSRTQTCTKSKSENISNRFKATALNGSPMKTRSPRRNSS